VYYHLAHACAGFGSFKCHFMVLLWLKFVTDSFIRDALDFIAVANVFSKNSEFALPWDWRISDPVGLVRIPLLDP
jgi:hypothetical protein